MIEVEVEDPAWTTALPDAAAIARRAAEASLLLTHEMGEGDRAQRGGGGEPGAQRLPPAPSVTRSSAGATSPVVFATGEEGLTILLTDDHTIRDLNARFRGKDAATNVLSFPAPETARPHIGDVALAYGVCAAEAAAQGKSLEHHLMHLTAHGVLHLLGYDHQSDAEAEAMEALERRILSGLGAPDPYGAEGQPDAHGD